MIANLCLQDQTTSDTSGSSSCGCGMLWEGRSLSCLRLGFSDVFRLRTLQSLEIHLELL